MHFHCETQMMLHTVVNLNWDQAAGQLRRPEILIDGLFAAGLGNSRQLYATSATTSATRLAAGQTTLGSLGDKVGDQEKS